MQSFYLILFNLFLNFFLILQAEQPISLVNPKEDWIAFFNIIKSVSNIDTFVESGTYLGQTTLLAAKCFPQIHTIEISEEYYKQASEILMNCPNVTIYHGNSAKILPQLLPKLKKSKILFWLDGHCMTCNYKYIFKDSYTPIKHELSAIINNKIDNTIILIDDARLFGSLLNGARIERAGDLHYPLLKNIVNYLKKNGFLTVIFGDILFSYKQPTELIFSKVINACTKSRLYDGTNYSIEEILEAEQVIAQADDDEKKALTELYIAYSKPWKAWYNKSPHYNLWYGLLMQANNDHEGACKQFDEVIQLGYNHWRLYWYLAKSLFYINDLEGTSNALNHILNQIDFPAAKELQSYLRNLERMS